MTTRPVHLYLATITSWLAMSQLVFISAFTSQLPNYDDSRSDTPIAETLVSRDAGVTLQNNFFDDSSAVTSSSKRGSDHVEESFPPLVTKPKGAYKMIVDDTDITVQCEASGYPEPRYQWYKDGIPLTSSGTYIKAFRNGSMVLVRFEEEHNGYFHCTATNALGVSVSDVIHIVKERCPTGTHNNEVFSRTDGDPVQLNCSHIPYPIPRGEKRWYVSQSRELPLNDRIGVNSIGDLFFSYVEKADSDRYSCALIPKDKNNIPLFRIGTMNVVSRTTEPTGGRPELMYSQEKTKGIIGRSMVLECFFASKPVATIQWYNASNHKVTNGKRYTIFDYGRKLKVKQVIQQDEGDFTCIGTNGFGSSSHHIRVNVTTPPMLVPGGALTAQVVPDSRAVTLKCQTAVATGEHLNQPLWMRNGNPLTSTNVPDPSRYKFSEDRTQLTISDLDKTEDTACFQCNSTNSEGYLFFNVYLKVINSIVVSYRPADVSVIDPGHVVDISVLATGDVCCHINKLWYFNGSLITPDTWPVFQSTLTSGELLFNSSLVSAEDLPSYTGLYTCRVSNPYQSVNVKFSIKLTASQFEPVTTKASSMGLWWIGLVCGIVAIIISVAVVVAVYKSNYPGSTYKLEEQEIKHHLHPEEDLMNQSFQEI